MVLSNRVYATNNKKKQVFIPLSQKDFLEQHIVKKRNAERDHQEYWSGTSKYFDCMEKQAARFNDLVSPETKAASSQAVAKLREAETRKEGLLGRRSRLKTLLQAESEQWAEELKNISKQAQTRDITDLRGIRQQFRLEREAEQRKESELKMLQHWKINNPTVRQVDSARGERMSRKYMEQQIREKQQREEQDREHQRLMEIQRLEQLRQEDLAREEEEAATQRKVEEWHRELRHQMEELRHRDRQQMVHEQQRHARDQFQRQVEACEEDRQRQAKARESRELMTFQKRQHQMKLKKVAEDVERELEEDKQKINQMIKIVEAQAVFEAAEKDKMLSEVRWMRTVLQSQQEEENRRREEMELMFAEEAEKMWAKQQEVWTREEQARKRLMAEVSDTWRKQIQEKVEAARAEEAEASATRQQVQAEVEQLNRYIQEAETDGRRQREDLVKGLDDGVREAEQRRREVRFRAEEAETEARLAEIRDENRLAQHLAQAHIQDAGQPYTQDFRRRKVRWYY